MEQVEQFFKNRKFNYHFDDCVKYGKRQPITSGYNHSDKMKPLNSGSLIKDEDIAKLADLPKKFDLKKYITEIHDQFDQDLAVSCAISTAISIRTKYINDQRYALTWLFLGNKFVPINPSVLYIHWNANIDNLNRCQQDEDKSLTDHLNRVKPPKCSPSIYAHLMSIETHKVVDISKYEDDLKNKLGMKPDLNTFYHARKSSPIDWIKINPSENTFKILLHKGYAIIAGIALFQESIEWMSFHFGLIMTPNPGENTWIGADVVTIVGYNDHKKVFTIVRSLGIAWGESGYGTIPYNYIFTPELAGDFAIIDYR